MPIAEHTIKLPRTATGKEVADLLEQSLKAKALGYDIGRDSDNQVSFSQYGNNEYSHISSQSFELGDDYDEIEFLLQYLTIDAQDHLRQIGQEVVSKL